MSDLLKLAGLALALGGCSANPVPLAERQRQAAIDRAYDRCLYRVTGPFAAASIEVMRECERQSRTPVAPTPGQPSAATNNKDQSE